MTYNFYHFSSYIPCPINQKIKVVDGSLAIVAKQGTITFNPSLSLKFILHICKLSINLMSIYQVTKYLNCKVTFFSSHYVVDDLDIGKIIGHAREQEEC